MPNLIHRNMALVIWSAIMATGALSLFFLHDMVELFTSDQGTTTLVIHEPKNKPKTDVPGLRPKKEYELIARRDIFSFPADQSSSGRGGGTERPTTLNVLLKATIVSAGGPCWAIILDPAERKERLYRVGDSLDDAKIVEIRRDEVVLMHGGRKEVLKLFAKTSKRRGPVSTAASAVRAGVRNLPVRKQPLRPAAQQASRKAQQRIRSLMAQLRLRPRFEGGRPKGFEVGQVREGSIFEAAGLRKGDIIVAINDQDVRSPTQLLKAYKEIAEDEEIWLDIVRDGQEDTVEIDLEGVLSRP